MTKPTDNQVEIEVCIGSLADALAAIQGGANRLELCGALELGGLTPSLGLVQQVVDAVDLPVLAMIRPRAGGFCYSEPELQAMLRDAAIALEAGAVGIVFGVLDEHANINLGQARQLVEVAGNSESVFHRAFDFVRDPLKSLDQLIDLGVTRVLTTGGPPTAVAGIDTLAAIARHAAGRIQIMPGGGITAENVRQIVRTTGCLQIHSGSAESFLDPSLSRDNAASLCDLTRIRNGALRVVDSAQVRQLTLAASELSVK